MESASLKDLSELASKGALLTVGSGGNVTVSDAFYQDNLLLAVKKDIQMQGLDFYKDISSHEKLQRGSIKKAEIHGCSINGVKALEVAGKSYFEGEVSIVGDLFVNGAVTVSGSIFGGGPYVDVSDQRMKKDNQKLDEGGSVL